MAKAKPAIGGDKKLSAYDKRKERLDAESKAANKGKKASILSYEGGRRLEERDKEIRWQNKLNADERAANAAKNRREQAKKTRGAGGFKGK